MRSHPMLNYVPRVASVMFRLRPPVLARLYITDAWKNAVARGRNKKKKEGVRERETPLSVRLTYVAALKPSLVGIKFFDSKPGLVKKSCDCVSQIM